MMVMLAVVTILKNASPKKRKQATAPKLIDYNKRHLERNLSANQYVQMFLKGLKNDSEFRHYMSQAMTESVFQEIRQFL